MLWSTISIRLLSLDRFVHCNYVFLYITFSIFFNYLHCYFTEFYFIFDSVSLVQLWIKHIQFLPYKSWKEVIIYHTWDNEVWNILVLCFLHAIIVWCFKKLMSNFVIIIWLWLWAECPSQWHTRWFISVEVMYSGT